MSHKFEPMPGNKPGRPCNKCLERKDHENHFTDSTKTERVKDAEAGCLICGKKCPSGEHFCNATHEEEWIAKKYPREWADMKRRGGKLNDAHLTHDRSRLHAALDAVLDHGRARDREPSMAEEKAYDMGVADAKKGSAQNPNPDWSRALKSAYVSGYHAGLGHGRARDAGVLTDDIEFDFSQNAKTGSGKKTPASIAKAIKMMERKYGPEVAAALRARHT